VVCGTSIVGTFLPGQQRLTFRGGRGGDEMGRLERHHFKMTGGSTLRGGRYLKGGGQQQKKSQRELSKRGGKGSMCQSERSLKMRSLTGGGQSLGVQVYTHGKQRVPLGNRKEKNRNTVRNPKDARAKWHREQLSESTSPMLITV